jgi:murein endopeptidase
MVFKVMDMRCCCTSYQVDTQNESNTSDGTLKEIQKWSQIESAATDKPKLREQVSTLEERNCYFFMYVLQAAENFFGKTCKGLKVPL